MQHYRHALIALGLCIVTLGCYGRETPTATSLQPQTDDKPQGGQTPLPTTHETTAAAIQREPVYDGLTLSEWQDRIKDLDPSDPASTDAVPGLIEIVRDSSVSWFTRRQAAMTLGRIGRRAAAAVEVLIELLDAREDIDEETVVWAAKALALFGPEARQAAPALIEILRDTSRSIIHRQATIEALARIGSAHPDAIPALIHLLGQSNVTDDLLRESAAEALLLLGPQAVEAIPVLIRATRDESEDLRRKSLAALGAMGGRGEIAIPAIVEAMAMDASPAVRDAAADALAGIGPVAVETLSHLLKDDAADLRRRAAGSLGKIGLPAKSAASLLLQRLDDEEPSVRIEAAEALWRIQAEPQPVVESLVDQLTDPDRQIRIRAVRLLIEMGPLAHSAVDALNTLADDERPHVRQAARKVLKKIQPSR